MGLLVVGSGNLEEDNRIRKSSYGLLSSLPTADDVLKLWRVWSIINPL